MSWTSPHGTLLPDWRKRTLIMGIMNLAPDSFSDGGQLPDEAAVETETHKAALLEFRRQLRKTSRSSELSWA